MKVVLLLLSLLIPKATYADMVGPAAHLTSRTYESDWAWIVICGILIEWPFYKKIANSTWKKAAKLTIGVSFICLFLGAMLTPEIVKIWGLVSTPIRETFDFWTWIRTIIFIAAFSVCIKAAALQIFFKIKFTKNVFCLLAAANIISIGLALILINVPVT